MILFSEEQHLTIDRDPKRGFGFTIRTAENRTSQDRVKIKEVGLFTINVFFLNLRN